ncbi:uncharacterized protein C2845_PM15G25490 [Panicum miliaceum]|uniref:Uncharacterized protein n=1 Tax=Panicum miliaceum TaxID=4540 RepID=A0A3L6QBH1_PANMI|nr:uncharacterized protein C2845_PM15G25490 [Panicum miliaceum]
MSRSRCLAASSLLLALAVAASATSPVASPLEARQQDKRTIIPSDAHLEEATRLLAAEGATRAAIWAEKDRLARPLEEQPGGGVATQGDDQSSSGSGEHGKEGEKQGKSCLTKEECHKKKLLCGKGCTLSAHSKCAAKCTKSCVPTC